MASHGEGKKEKKARMSKKLTKTFMLSRESSKILSAISKWSLARPLPPPAPPPPPLFLHVARSLFSYPLSLALMFTVGLPLTRSGLICVY